MCLSYNPQELTLNPFIDVRLYSIESRPICRQDLYEMIGFVLKRMKQFVVKGENVYSDQNFCPKCRSICASPMEIIEQYSSYCNSS